MNRLKHNTICIGAPNSVSYAICQYLDSVKGNMDKKERLFYLKKALDMSREMNMPIDKFLDRFDSLFTLNVYDCGDSERLNI